MKVKIAVFGRKEIIDKFSNLSEKQNDMEIVPFTYKNEQETVELIEKAFMCDVYIFTETLPFLYVQQKVEKKRLPVILLPHDELTIISSLYQLQDNGQAIDRLSIDIGDEKIVSRALEEIHFGKKQVHVYDYGLDSEVSIENIIDHHTTLWENGQIDHVLTSIKTVENHLEELNIPTSSMVVPNIYIERTIQQAKSKVRLNLSKGAQVVTGYLQIKEHESIKAKQGSQELERIMAKLHKILSNFSKKTDVSIFKVSEHQMVLFGTKALINHLTNHFRDFPLLREIKSEIDIPVNIGYGLGLTAKQSDVNAKIALETCQKTEDSNCYIVNERQETIGPIGVIKEFDASKLYHALIHKARLNNELSYNFIDFIRIRNNEPFSSNDVANYYNVTKRSAERTVNKLLSGEVIKVSGEERPYQKGRPRKLFTLNQ